MFGFVQFNKEVIAAGVAEKTGKIVKLGRLNWQADSFHISEDRNFEPLTIHGTSAIYRADTNSFGFGLF